MIETLGGVFGVFSAEPVGHVRDFHWGIDLFAHDNAVLLSGYHQDEFQFNVEPTRNTIQYLSIVMPRNGGMGVTCGQRRAQAGQGKLLLYNNSEADSVAMYGQSNLIDELLLSWSVILQTIDQTFDNPLSGSLDLLQELSLATPVGQTIGNLATSMMSGMRDDGPLLKSPIAMAHITQALADLVIRTVPHRLSHLLNRKPNPIAPRHVRRAIEFMQANISQSISMAAVAAAAGVSIRALQTGFRDFKDTTPLAYLMKLRLRAARLDLLDPGNDHPVNEICMKWGFLHPGRFSVVYRATYGEYPSETKKYAGSR